ncbi:hypothetical protein DMB95_00215 [Campylobacter sp. MIT 12-8780]|uniref:hypothetical protein n=1 Tax=unclassified Campylobacter TaxID=2593542 RepID=UPI00115DB288|nr:MULTISPECIES: hypothetical protein [unclassified Campylobacter]NDJ26384.1 hypothetical protein [Campylobacter sp. MIT 19-121]TQR42960.1 hypothetical protein DMB95_00215 [Campylobacter sp. MIT 12-8780]
MRLISLPRALNCVKKDRFSNSKSALLKLKQGENELELSRFGGYYQSEERLIFRVYEGKGVLEFEHALKNFDFSKLNLAFLEHFLCHNLHHQNADTFDKKMIALFLDFDLILQEKGEEYIINKAYQKLCRRLFAQ